MKLSAQILKSRLPKRILTALKRDPKQRKEDNSWLLRCIARLSSIGSSSTQLHCAIAGADCPPPQHLQLPLQRLQGRLQPPDPLELTLQNSLALPQATAPHSLLTYPFFLVLGPPVQS